MRCVTIAVCLVLGAVGGCQWPAVAEKLADDKTEKTAADYISMLRSEDYEPILRAMDPCLKNGSERLLLAYMNSLFPEGEPIERRLIGYDVLRFASEYTQHNLTYQYEYADSFLVMNVAFREFPAALRKIVGLNVEPVPEPLQLTHRFTLAGKTFAQYVVLTTAGAVALFILLTLVVCIRTPMPRRKWVWVVFVALGFATVWANWTTGQFGVQLLSVELLGASAFSASPYAPWIVKVSFPIGAILFWVRRDRLCTAGTGNGR